MGEKGTYFVVEVEPALIAWRNVAVTEFIYMCE